MKGSLIFYHKFALEMLSFQGNQLFFSQWVTNCLDQDYVSNLNYAHFILSIMRI